MTLNFLRRWFAGGVTVRDENDNDTEPQMTHADRVAFLSAEFARLRSQGWTVRAIAAEYAVCSATVCKYTAGHPHQRAKLTAEQQAEVRRLRAGGAKLAQLARRFGVATCTVVRICKPDRPPLPPGKLTEEDVRKLRALAAAGGHTQKELAAMFGVSQSCVCHAVTGRTWPAAGGATVKVGAKRKLTADAVRTIRAMVTGGTSQQAAGERFGVEQTTVGKIVHRRIWKWVE